MIDTTQFSIVTLTANNLMIRKATLDDAQGIAELVNLGEREGQLLPRSLESICASIGDWFVAEDQGHIVSIGALVEMNPMLAEIRSLAVTPDYRKFGIGGKIVNALVDEARTLNIPTVFALTRAVLFFEKQGFIVTDKENFPEKVWRDCVNCPVQFACDEVAMVLSVDSKQNPVSGTDRLCHQSQFPIRKSEIQNP